MMDIMFEKELLDRFNEYELFFILKVSYESFRCQKKTFTDQELADLLSWSIQSVMAVRQNLLEKGVLELVKRISSDPSRATCAYHFTILDSLMFKV